ncbi:hypothetical protein CIW48_20175 [Methylobacterium sp. P1-11]|uniref:hypothetical protein n=1 Tax=Methylobacterium sp. P1-11 TaxID=2024616 RepID=UPI0011EC0916|nr:hypothetical protein [Methylobacterium sp. P1-11]KAA0122062.1 hypothetical protein CIW48_20175 [Methylobacterium sp. P1-11]
MSHARIPDFSPRPIALAAAIRTLAADPVLAAADPVLAAIDTHAEAWAVRAAADAGWQFEIAEIQLCAALGNLLATPCSSHTGALALIRHLRWLIRQEGITAETDGWFDRFVLAREADLSRFVGSDLLPAAAPTGCLAQQAERRAPPCRTEAPREARQGLLRVSGLAGEVLAAVAIIGAGAVLTGLATLL